MAVRIARPRVLVAALLGASILVLPRVSPCTPRQGSAAGPETPARGASAAPGLAATDTVVLAHFENRTGDTLFDDTLRQALAFELEESPFVNVLGDRQVQAALQAQRLPPGLNLTADAGRKVCVRTGFITGSLMYLQLGRAYGVAGQPAQAHAAYRKFFALWSGADAHVPVLEQAGKNTRSWVEDASTHAPIYGSGSSGL